jgi:ribose/xylose/arabinose/galactoside ABC-type transport system permease subunit
MRNKHPASFRSRVSGSGGIVLFLLLLAAFFQLMTGRAVSSDGAFLDWFRSGNFLTELNIKNVLRQVSINTILGVGMTFVIIAGGIDLSVGSVLALAGVLSTAIVMRGFPPPFPYPSATNVTPTWPLAASVPVAVVIAALVGGMCGLHNALPIVRLRVPPFIATLAMFSIARGLAFIYVNAGQVANLPGPLVDAIGDGQLLIFLAFATVGLGHVLLTRTRFGRAVYAVGGSEKAAHLSGINVGGVKFRVYVLCGLLAGISGFLLAGRLGAGDPKSGMTYELNAIAAVVLGGTSLMGGTGSVLGTFLGAVVIGALENGLGLMSVDWFVQMLVKGYVILLAVILDQTKKQRRFDRT